MIIIIAKKYIMAIYPNSFSSHNLEKKRWNLSRAHTSSRTNTASRVKQILFDWLHTGPCRLGNRGLPSCNIMLCPIHQRK